LRSEIGHSFEYLSSFIENKYNDVQGIFITLDSVIYGPNNFEKAEFDKFLAWAAEIKKQGKTLVLMSQYQILQTKYLADHMNFVINCIPDQRGAASGICSFAVQWLKFDTDAEVDLTACRSINLTQDQSDTIQYQVKYQENSRNAYFALTGYNNYYKKRCWCRFASNNWLSSY